MNKNSLVKKDVILKLICICAGGGKSSLANKYPNHFFDLDLIIDWGNRTDLSHGLGQLKTKLNLGKLSGIKELIAENDPETWSIPVESDVEKDNDQNVKKWEIKHLWEAISWGVSLQPSVTGYWQVLNELKSKEIIIDLNNARPFVIIDTDYVYKEFIEENKKILLEQKKILLWNTFIGKHFDNIACIDIIRPIENIHCHSIKTRASKHHNIKFRSKIEQQIAIEDWEMYKTYDNCESDINLFEYSSFEEFEDRCLQHYINEFGLKQHKKAMKNREIKV